MHFMTCSTDAEDANMPLDIPSTMNYVLNGQLALNLVNICLNNMSVIAIVWKDLEI